MRSLVQLRARLTYANVVATLALFVALTSGAAFAASQLGKNTVGNKQLRKNAVTGAKVKNGSLTGADIKLSELGTVPSAASAATAARADTAATATSAGTAQTAASAGTASVANALAPAEPTHVVGAPGEPAFLNGSSDFFGKEGPSPFQKPSFFKDRAGFVHLEGYVVTGSGKEFPQDGALFVLPPGFRPATTHLIPGFAPNAEIKSTEDFDAFFVFPSNTVVDGVDFSGLVLSTGSQTALEGLTFRAEG